MSAILIRCKLIRAGGSKITMADGTPYHFKDDGSGSHVAVVADEDHQSRLLAIPEAYAFHGAFQPVETSAQTLGAELIPAKAAPVLSAEPASVVTAPDVLTSTTAVTLPEGPLGEVNAKAIGGTDLNQSQSKSQQEHASVPTPAPANELEALSLDELREVFKTETGKAASASKKPDVMISQIMAIRAERAKQ
jgi:hypothetical protein